MKPKHPPILPIPSNPVVIDNPIGLTPEQIIGKAVKQAEAERQTECLALTCPEEQP